MSFGIDDRRQRFLRHDTGRWTFGGNTSRLLDDGLLFTWILGKNRDEIFGDRRIELEVLRKLHQVIQADLLICILLILLPLLHPQLFLVGKLLKGITDVYLDGGGVSLCSL